LTMARFDFFGNILTGQEEPITRWKRGVSLVSFYLGDAIGRIYVDRHFPPDSKLRVQHIVKNVLEAYKAAIGDADWMAGPTKSEAKVKLWNLKSQIGYPEKWRDYAGLRIEPDDLLGNVQRAQQWDNEFKQQTIKRGQLDGLWTMTPQTLNAYYNLASNEIVFPAAILQPPYFDPAADEAVNYGAIGAVIGHEIGHGFDGRGRAYDSTGTLRDWWTARDEEQFAQRAALLIAQYNAYSPLADVHVNGAITLEENLADLGGLSIALRAYKLSLGGKPAPVIDGLTGEQRFFIGWARIWRAKTRPEYLRQTIGSAPHAPPEFRANGVVSNIPAFYDAFDVKPGDKLYREPVLRVRVW
jgi:putative endopeptidase